MAEGLSRAAILPEPALPDAAALIDGGVSTDPDALADRAAGADLIALGSYNGVVLDYLDRLGDALAARGRDLPIFVGGKLNRVPDASNTSLPVEVSAGIAATGATPCRRIEDLLAGLAAIARSRP